MQSDRSFGGTDLLKTLLQDRIQVSLGPDSLSCLADEFKALADTTRLHIIYLLLTSGEMCVCEFMPALGLTQSNVSFHLKTLKHAGFITSRREGKWIYYCLNRKALEQFRSDFGNVFDLGRWPEKIGHACCEITACKQMEMGAAGKPLG